MTRRAAAILLAILALAVAALLVFSRPGLTPGQRRRFRLFLRVSPVAKTIVTAVAGAPSPTPQQTVRVTLFFLGAEDGKLQPEERDIAKPAAGGPYVKALFAELKRGPTHPGLISALPEKIQLRNAFLLPEGVVVLDLAVDSGLSFGASEELAIVATLVDTTLQNVADTSRVRILVNGEPAETLGGHVDLTHPLVYLRGELAP